MWESYEKQRNHPHDFEVTYHLYSKGEGGRKATYQGYRCDFMYSTDDAKDGIYCIHPEFENEFGNLVTDVNKPVSLDGVARMWILFPQMRELVHKERIEIGIKGYMMEGARKVGEFEVTKIVGLYTNNEVYDMEKLMKEIE